MRSKYEKLAQKALEQDGWEVDWKARPFRTPMGYNVDFFGRFDLLASRDNQIRFISVKGHGGIPGEHRRKIENFTVPPNCTKEIWVYTRPTINKIKQKKEICKIHLIS